MGNCILCKIKLPQSNPNNRCVQTITVPNFKSKKFYKENTLKNHQQSNTMKMKSPSNHIKTKDCSANNSVTSFNKSFNEIFRNSNEHVELALDRNNNRHASNSSSKYTEASFFNNTVSHTDSKKLTTISKNTHLKRSNGLRNKHVFCDSSLETETISNDSTHCEPSQKSLSRNNEKQRSVHLFHISRIPPPSPLPYRRKMEMSDFPTRNTDQLELPMIEYTFYVTDEEICRRPLIDKRVKSIVSNCNCFLKIHGRPTNSNYADQQSKKIFYKGNPVIPITLKSYNMTSLRKCIGRLDVHFPYFNVKAFLNS